MIEYKCSISIIIPIYNEEGNILQLHNNLTYYLKKLKKSYEIIYVDDGSQDQSCEIIRDIVERDKCTKALFLMRNFGQTAAISAGIDNSDGEMIILIDGDNENDPSDIKKLLEKMKEGFDVVSGWRKKRWQGKLISRKIPSIIANMIICNLTTVMQLHFMRCQVS